MVDGVREHTRNPPRGVRETLLRSGWWRDADERPLGESGRADADRFFGRGPAVEQLRVRVDALVSPDEDYDPPCAADAAAAEN